MNEHEIRLRALELVVERRADWQTTDQIIATARSYAEFVLGTEAAAAPLGLGQPVVIDRQAIIDQEAEFRAWQGSRS